MWEVGRVTAILLGGATALWVLISAIRTVVVPRGEPVLLTRAVFLTTRKVWDLKVNRKTTFEDRDRAMAYYAPMSLMILPGVWVTVVVAAFTAVYWGLHVDPLREAFYLSGSSMLTLGFTPAADIPAHVVSFVEATLGLGLVALLISYLPSIYSSFQRRELFVARMATRAGAPPSALEMILRAQAIGRLDRIDLLWEDCETWFADLEETHTSQPSLVFFRSISHDRSWITAAGVALDTAALRQSTLDLPRSAPAALCLRAGRLALRRIATYFDIPVPVDPQRGDPISIDRSEFDDAYDRMAAAGVPLKADRDLAWLDFAGWRVNYDAPLLGLAGLAMAPYGVWSSDRSLRVRFPRLTRFGRARARNGAA